MNMILAAILTAIAIFGCLIAAILVGRVLRYVLPEEHVSTDSRDAVKLSMSLVATMSALVLGLLVSSAKDSYDTKRNEVIQMAAKVAFLDRVLTGYGPEAAEARALVRTSVEIGIRHLWPADGRRPANTFSNVQAGNLAYEAIQRLSPHNEMQTNLKAQALTLAINLAEVRSLLVAQSVTSISLPMLIILVSWLVVIFIGFSVLAPSNVTTIVALMISAFAVCAAIFLLLELDQPFGGLIRIPNQPMLDALHQIMIENK
jgi:hypothetical protein